ncbi:hypothetical protein FOZ63_002883 [Perkinsus olseni]|uniref:Uncharacterized protein n=1 Tax=Perkinsus olseni TaxID=32597 RepID=A0A7J6QCS1_PEROL|nr:hypothetical protein FOZ63_002883 [Perkinsus olseni]
MRPKLGRAADKLEVILGDYGGSGPAPLMDQHSYIQMSAVDKLTRDSFQEGGTFTYCAEVYNDDVDLNEGGRGLAADAGGGRELCISVPGGHLHLTVDYGE